MLWVKMPRLMEEDDLRLRPLRISDAAPVTEWLRRNVIFKPAAPGRPACLSRFLLWWWMKKRFTCSFSIEVESRPVGFVGLYNMRLGKSAEITLVIFDGTLRRHGYGTRAFRLLARNLKRHSVVQRISARVEADNHIALSFWKSLGFMEVSSIEGITGMSLDLNG